ncbi:MAG TPA: VWA domain-containing protein [Candidatus Acidoferrales bacterium]|nr:VWA domain-containing protein [Candidatus Acidoferrales bacterium]
MLRIFAISIVTLAAMLAAADAAAQAKPVAPPAPPAAPAQQNTITPPQTPQIVRPAYIVKLVATVMDRRHKFVTDLSGSDFKVFEDGHPQSPTLFFRQADLPLRIGMLLDTSGSIRERLHFEKDAAIDFLYNVIRRGKDQAFLMTFDSHPEIIQDYTEDLDVLSSVIQQQNAGNGTALDDAVYLASQKLMNAPPAAEPTQDVRRVIVVISDGDDNESEHARSEAIEIADKASVSIYSISTNNDWVSLDTPTPQKLLLTPGDKVLAQYSDETGGRAFFPYRIDDLSQSFLDIGNELRSQYLIGYPPPYGQPDGQFHTIDVKVERKGLIVRTRKGYYAIAPPAAPAATGATPKP